MRLGGWEGVHCPLSKCRIILLRSWDYVSEMSSFYFVVGYFDIRIRMLFSFTIHWFSNWTHNLSKNFIKSLKLLGFYLLYSIKSCLLIISELFEQMTACWLSISPERERERDCLSLSSLLKLVYTEHQRRTQLISAEYWKNLYRKLRI